MEKKKIEKLLKNDGKLIVFSSDFELKSIVKFSIDFNNTVENIVLKLRYI